MKNEALERPVITEFMGDGFTLNKAHKQYLENLELWNYVQVLDAYCDSLEGKLSEGQPVADTESGLHLADVKASFSNKYGFLYWCENDTTADDGRCKWIEASTLDEACEKFLKKAPKTLRQVDYEVQLGDKYIDISERADFQNWL